MFESTRRGFKIARSSLRVVEHDPKLFLLPIVSTTSLLALTTLIFGSIYAGWYTNFASILVVIGFPAFWIGSTFVTVFFNAALVSCVLDAFAGREVSLRAGLKGSVTRLSPIFLWVLYATTVGLLISLFQRLTRKLGVAILGTAASLTWAITTYFVIPVLVAEGVGPEEALERSTQIVERNWGTAVGTQTGIFLLGHMLAVVPPILVLGYVNGWKIPLGPPGHDVVLAGLAVGAYLVLVLGMFSALGVIFRTGVYYFATTGRSPLDLDHSLYASALRTSDG